jgi:hypothetical protein
MANEDRTGPEERLTATVGERLGAKEDLERDVERERQAAEGARARLERRKGEERAAVEEHLEPVGGASPSGWRALRERARARGRSEARARDWGGRGLPIAGAALALAGIFFRRRALVLAGVPLLGGALLLRRRIPLR